MPYTVFSTSAYDALAEPLYALHGEALDDAEGNLRDQLAERPTLGLNLGSGLYQTQLHLPTGELSVFIAVSKASEEAFLIAIYAAEELRTPSSEQLATLRAEAAELAS